MGNTILLVDDEYASLEVLALLLRNAGYQIATASDGEEALVRLREERPDLVITDYWMPKMDGLELCRHMREDDEWRSIPVLLMTAAYDVRVPPAPEVNGILPKPIQYPAILSIIKEVLAAKPSS